MDKELKALSLPIEERIEEIAIEVGNNCVDFYGNDIDYCCIEEGLRQIATEQKAIDDEELGKALLYCTNKTAERVKREMIEKGCEFLKQQGKDWWEGYGIPFSIEDYRKALEG